MAGQLPDLSPTNGGPGQSFTMTGGEQSFIFLIKLEP